MKAEKSNINTIVTDQALLDPAEDTFGRDLFAKRIASILISKNTPDHLTIGIYGKWGDGKTSVINFIKHYLDEEYKDQAIYIDFNPWRYKNEEYLLNSFFKQFAQGITHKLGEKGKKVAKTILAYSGLIVALAEPVTGLAMFSKIRGWEKVKGLVSKGYKDFVTDTDFSPAIESLEHSLEKTESLEKQKQRISRQLEKTGKKHIVFIDDIDRLNSEEIQILFSLLKVTADFENVIYVLSFDPAIVATALGQTYPESGHSFLEKIIQVPLNLPKVPKTDLFNELLYPGINSILANSSIFPSESEGREIADALRKGLEQRLNTPRMVKRYLNALTFAIPILKGEANIQDLLLIEGLRVCYPEIYELVYVNKDVFIFSDAYKMFQTRTEIEKEQSKQREQLLVGQGKSVRQLLTSLFHLQNDLIGHKIDMEDLAKNQRIASEYYFERYFSYSIPRKDIGDQQIANFITSLPSHSLENSFKQATQLIEDSNESLFLRKIEENKEIVLKSGSLNLALLLARLGNRFIKYDDSIIDFNSPLRKASYLIKEVIQSLSSDERLEVVKKILKESTNIILTAEIGRELYPDKESEEILKEEEFKEVQKLIADYIKKDAEEHGPFFLRENTIRRNSVLLMNLWTYGSTVEVSKFIEKSIDNEPSNAIEFLKDFLPIAYAGPNQEVENTRFEADEYTKVKRLISPKIIYEVLLKEYKDVIINSQYKGESWFSSEPDKRIAVAFSYYYERDLEFNDKEDKSKK